MPAVGDDQAGAAALELGQLVHDLPLVGRVERGGRLFRVR